jgi:glucose-6-phosphate 1-epimerase
LHTYLRVSDAASVRLEGLHGTRYVNRGDRVMNVEEGAFVGAAQPVDRIYFGPPSALTLRDAARRLEISQRGFTDTVVWNPGAERASQMADMAPDGYRRMLCVEAAAIEPPIALPPGHEWSGMQSITVSA